MAANIHICDIAVCGQTPGDGSTWSNALDDLPASLVRGNTYYIADGNYASYVFDDAESGELVITIKKSTAADHGTETGYVSTDHNGQAIFTASGETYLQGLNFRTGYYTIDGQVGSGSDYSTYGFKVVPADSTHSEQLIGIPNLGSSSYQIDNIIISHVAMVNSGIGDGTKTRSGIYSLVSDISLASHTITISNNYFSGGHTNIMIIRGHDWTVRDNYFADNWSSADAHGQQITAGISDDLTFSGNTFFNSTVYAISAHRYSETGKLNYRWLIYNNIMIGSGESNETDLNAFVGNSTSSETDNVLQWQVHHNTMINVDFTNASTGFVFPGTLSDVATDKSYAYNNLFYNCVGPRMDNLTKTEGAVVHDYNSYLASTGTYSGNGTVVAETNGQVDTDALATDIFTDYANEDYSLKIGALPINNGKTDLGATYALDYAGTERGASPDIGAYEYVGTSDVVAPATPTGLSVT
ncbi:MAG TPA: hypothetical protein P5323_01625 [Candidatus Moranbacteria bacterium]|nr:hypothetical protein [Candidatus Moranbacteria bacterium]HSA08107.1 hypothetical protein [Candidatus Moranbacteria bacterium]